jgi:HEAT repeat protein
MRKDFSGYTEVMRNTGILLLLLAWLAAPAVAEETAAPDSAAAWKKLDQEYQAAVKEFWRPWREAKACGEKCELDYTTDPRRTFVPRFLAFAQEHGGTDEALQALIRAIQYTSDDKERATAVAALLKDHIESKGIKQAVWALRSRAPDALGTIIEKTPHRDVRGFALLTRAQMLKKIDSEKALGIFKDLKHNYAEVPYRGEVTLAQKAEGEIFEIENLSVGKVAPEIEGEDLAGVSFKLSDYLGKVVMLDFWGDW